MDEKHQQQQQQQQQQQYLQEQTPFSFTHNWTVEGRLEHLNRATSDAMSGPTAPLLPNAYESGSWPGPPPAPGVPAFLPPTLVPVENVVVCRQDEPHYMTCGSCHHVVMPRPEMESGICTWGTAIALCMLGCWPLVFVPFCCCDSVKDTVFHCPICNAELYRLRAP